MLPVGVISLFPEMFDALGHGVTGRAIKKQNLSLSLWNPRDYSNNEYGQIDDRPYGGGPGMVMMVEPLRQAIRTAKDSLGPTAKTVYLSPQGEVLKQTKLNAIASQKQPLILVAGRYEGIDERLIALEIDEEWSIGDYVLSGGELAAMLVIDALSRLLPGSLGHECSASQDSFMNGLLDCPHYTRPEKIAGLSVPKVLLSGDHKAIERWRLKQAIGRTWERRSDLLEGRTLSELEQELLTEYKNDH
jgi:tRNA (guanine37-N1)-methyltransferase